MAIALVTTQIYVAPSVLQFSKLLSVSNAFAASAMTLKPFPDRSVSSSGSLTSVALGTPLATDATDPTPTISHNAPGATSAPGGAVAYWSFDNNLQDQSNSANDDGTTSDDARIASNYMGRALILDGTNDYVTVSDSQDLKISSAFTISAWIKLSTLSPDADHVRVLEKGGDNDNKYWMYYAKLAKKIGFGFISSGNEVNILTTKTDWQSNKWYHIVGTFDPSASTNNMKIYVNGIMDSQATKTGIKPVSNSEPLRIGTKASASWAFWEGELDELRIYKKSLTSAEVSSLYKLPFVSLPAGTNVITWRATNDAGNTVTAVQVVDVRDPNNTSPTTTLALNGIRYPTNSDPSYTGMVFVNADTHFDLDITSSTTVKGTYYRYFDPEDLSAAKPNFSLGKYFQIGDAENGKHIVQFFSKESDTKSESLTQKEITVDNAFPMASSSVSDGSTVTGSITITAKDNNGGSGIAGRSTSGIYYKLDSAASYTFVKSASATINLASIANGGHTLYFYAADNLGNREPVKSIEFTKGSTSVKTYTFCKSGCDYSNLQTAINALPAGGGVIDIRPASYSWSNTINMKSGTTLKFAIGASLYFTGGSKPIFRGDGVSNVSINGGTITAENAGVKAIAFWDSSGIKVTGTKLTLVKGENSNAFYCVDCKNVVISDIIAKSATRLVDIKTASRTNDGSTSNIRIQDSTFTGASIEAVKINHSRDVHIVGNSITDSNDNGIDIGWNTNSEVRDNSLVRTGMPDGAAIHPDSANGADIISNNIDTTGGTAIPVYRASNINVIGNTIKNAGDEGVSVIDGAETSKNIVVKSNHIISPAGHGIYVSPNQYQVEISANTLEDLVIGKSGVLVIWSNNTTVEVFGNDLL